MELLFLSQKDASVIQLSIVSTFITILNLLNPLNYLLGHVNINDRLLLLLGRRWRNLSLSLL